MENNFIINNIKLDNAQIDAIKYNDNTLVVAGAGSGKTLTILAKIKYLIDECNINENEILCISFTNETVKSLKDKVIKLGYNVNVLTFHKLALSILGNVNIISDNYLEYIINEYFEAYIKYNNKKSIKALLFSNLNINNLYKTNEYINLKKTILTFIRLFKSNNMDINDLYKIYKHKHFNDKKILLIIMELLTIYKRECESINGYDFDDLIINAANLVKNKKFNYKWIIIDEFQDTSIVRFNLINEIIKVTSAKVFLVGDDYQSIYRFSGCSLEIFLNINTYFNNIKTFYLKYTYRFSNELIYVSTSFIMKNKKQLKKNIISNKNLDKPIKIIFNYSVNEVINLINNKDILIIGRNNSDIANINWSNKLTIHRSKGLESENVILVNSDNIPSKIKNSDVLKYVIHHQDYIIYEEERRLFYVALTRTKNNIYIMVNKKISSFVKELIHDYKNYIEIIKK